MNKKRFTSYIIVQTICVLISVFGVCIYHALTPKGQISDVYIDGSDVSGLFNILGVMWSGFAFYAIAFILFIITFLITLIHRLIAIRKDSIIEEKEMLLSKRVLRIGLLVSGLLCLFVMFKSAILILTVHVMIYILNYLLYLRVLEVYCTKDYDGSD